MSIDLIEVKKLVSQILDSNTFVVSNGENAIIVDCGASIEEVKKATKGKKVVAILLSHGHFDHAYYLEEYVKEFGCKIYANQNAKKSLSNPNLNYGEGFCINDFSNFVWTNDDGEVEEGEMTIKYFYCSGHSNCLNVYQIDDLLFSGDCIFARGIGRCDLATSSVEQMLESLEKLDKIEFSTCYCGHYEDSDFDNIKRNIAAHIKYFRR